MTRNYYLVSVYNEDNNKDSLITRTDLRYFYHFDLEVQTKTLLIAKEYSVLYSDYDYKNDMIFIYARLDENGNSYAEVEEPMHILVFIYLTLNQQVNCILYKKFLGCQQTFFG